MGATKRGKHSSHTHRYQEDGEYREQCKANSTPEWLVFNSTNHTFRKDGKPGDEFARWSSMSRVLSASSDPTSYRCILRVRSQRKLDPPWDRRPGAPFTIASCHSLECPIARLHLSCMFYEGCVNQLAVIQYISCSFEGQHRWCWPSLKHASNIQQGSVPLAKAGALPGRCLTGARPVWTYSSPCLTVCMVDSLGGSNLVQANRSYPVVVTENRLHIVAVCLGQVCSRRAYGSPRALDITTTNYLQTCRGEPHVLSVILTDL